MTLTTTHRRGGHKTVHVIECHLCGAMSSPQIDASFAWADAKASGWEIRDSYPLHPKCPACVSPDALRF